MPSASDPQRALMLKWFNDAISDSGPTEFLLARGWTEAQGMWYPPVPSHRPSDYEIECLIFLRDEWDHDFRWPLPLFERPTDEEAATLLEPYFNFVVPAEEMEKGA